jgi:glycerol kinase
VRVLIQNGAGVEGLGSRVVSFIAAQGYPTTDLLQPMNSPSGATARSEIIDIDGTHEKNAYLLAQWLGIDVARVRTATTAEATSMQDSGATIVVLLGADEDFDSVIENASAGTRRGG